MDAERIYRETVSALREQIEGHQCPNGRSSLKAFCEEYGVNRANLMTILGGHQDMSVGLFIRILTSLGKVTPAGIRNAGELDHVSLKSYLMIEYIKIWELLLAIQIDK